MQVDLTNRPTLAWNLFQMAFVMATGKPMYPINIGFNSDDEGTDTTHSLIPYTIAIKAKVLPGYSVLCLVTLEKEAGDWAKGTISLRVGNIVDLVLPDAEMPPPQHFTWRKDAATYVAVEPVPVAKLAT